MNTMKYLFFLFVFVDISTFVSEEFSCSDKRTAILGSFAESCGSHPGHDLMGRNQCKVHPCKQSNKVAASLYCGANGAQIIPHIDN